MDKNVKPEYPLRFTVRFDHGSTSWEIPYGVGNKYTPNGWSVKNIDFFTNEISRSLCLLNYSQNISLTIVISTSNVDNIRFNMKFLIELNFFLQILWWNFLLQFRFLLQIKDNPNYITKVNQPAHADSVKIGSPIFHYVDLRGINGYLQVSVKSNDDSVCGIISVHPLKCPLTDITTEDNMNDDEVRDVIAI